MPTDRIRTTISIDPEVFEVFKGMAEAGNMSVSRCMGEWLADTVEGAQFVANKMREARAAPVTVMREFQAMAAGFTEDVALTLEAIRADKKAQARRSPAQHSGRASRAVPPASNTGVKVPPSPLVKSKSKP